MRLTELRIQDFKRIKLARIAFDDKSNVIVIRGANGAGKSSVLDAFAALIGGKDACPEVPVRRGEERAEVVGTFDDLIVTRKWTADGKTSLIVAAKDGARYPSPQAMLERLIGPRTFDPLAFGRDDPKAQAAALRAVIGLDTSDLDERRARLYEQRTPINQRLRDLVGQTAGLPPPSDEPPEPEVSVAALAAEHSAAVLARAAKYEARRNEQRARSDIDTALARISQAEREVEAARAALDIARGRAGAAQAAVDAMADPDVAGIEARIADAEAHNARVRQAAERDRKAAELRAAQESADAKIRDLTAQIAAIDEERAARLAAAKMPVEGLGFDAETGGVTFDGLPFSQASQSQQARIEVAIGCAANPTLRVLLVREGSLYDAESMRLLGEIAEEYDAQVLVERVDGESGVLIEDGEVVETAKAEKPRRKRTETPA